MSIAIDKITKFFDSSKVLNDISLNINSGELVALLGPSGSGKTTLLRIIAGLEYQNSGRVCFSGKNVSRMHARERHVGFVFQHYALFRHMTVAENVAFGLTILPRRKRPAQSVIKQKVASLLEMVQLSQFATRYPSLLSGGQKQRVALARALAVEPEILLLDEPFGALDAQVRKELRRWLRQLHEELKFTSVFVTHDQEEAMEVADRVVVMSQGNIEQVGTPQEVWREPASRFVLEFLGEVNRLDGEIRGAELLIGPCHWPLHYRPVHQGSVELFFRPWEMSLSEESTTACPLPVQIIDVSPRGHYWQLVVQPIGWHTEPLTVTRSELTAITPSRGDRCYLGGQHARIYIGDQAMKSIVFNDRA
ncbi:sulfate/thiosulfate ABC transporter ATP-binding protein CysA [secondary endosymbiont of Ctenarytaina eucalypti]|uniref:Sulfate ABC transporter, ATP-binding protein n=1 Tax=secondary endosymbiont of Ctenarytaina eucalypti TaxID=1199245 RepID=J3TF78_9ENTR|nr:sulfate/thiosulfate ABC transporter ATP-binding protein CysA [secondary endosymbiont of Ctenarytaina eucalypti]AFP84767.1 sulfate ABC transporter, ATP-binding protein [secondary endosymbiont of Ctenarytaina eucalypti]